MSKVFIVDICKTSQYTDNNGVTWWSDKYRGTPDILKLYKGLEGEQVLGTTITNVFEEGNVIKAYVSSENDISGYYINPRVIGELTEDKHIESIDYSSISLAGIPLVEEYAVEGLLPCREVVKEEK